jgi:hypothetical protein
MCDFARICTFVLLTNLDVVHHCLPVVRQPLRYLFTTAYLLLSLYYTHTLVLLANLDVVHHCLPVVRQPLRYLYI